jgi:putative membrane protein
MTLIASALTGLVALSHIGFLVLEMFFWDHPVGRKIFAMTPEVSASSAVLAKNQGLWGLVSGRRDVKVFFLSCVVIAGVFGGITAKPTILLTQALPGSLALVFVLASSRGTRPSRAHAEPPSG